MMLKMFEKGQINLGQIATIAIAILLAGGILGLINAKRNTDITPANTSNKTED